MIEYCEKKEITYTRFVDDLFFSSKHDFRFSAFEIIDLIKEDNFKISRKKTFYTEGVAETTGVRIKNNGISVTLDFKEKIKNSENSPQNQLNGRLMYKKRVELISKTKTKHIKTVLFT